MSELTTTQNSLPAKPTSPALSPVLKTLLVQEPSTETACRLIASNPAMLAEVTAAIPALKDYATRPAGDDGVKRVIGPRLAVFPPTQRVDGEWDAWWADYFTALRGIPETALEAGMLAWIKQPGSRFMPMPGELLALAKSSVNGAARAYQRAKGAIEWQPPQEYEIRQIMAPTPRGIDEPTAADKARVKAQLAEFLANRPAKPIDTKPPPIPPSVDEKGISAEMRALMARREA